MEAVSMQKVSQVSYTLSQRLYTSCSTDIDQNVFISPLSISLSLAMLLMGAENKTKDQLLSLLGLGSDDCQNLHENNHNLLEVIAKEYSENILISNKIFIQENEEILDKFLTGLKNLYSASCATTTFASDPNKAAKEINSWVKESTKDKIRELVTADDLDPMTALLLGNAVYFKSFWAQPFRPESTKPMDFTLLNGDVIKVRTMFQSKKFNLCRVDELDCDAIELPYKDEKLKMVIFLPREIDGLRKIEEGFNFDIVKKVQTEAHKVKVDLHLPSFKFSESYQLSDILQNLGVTDAFASGLADFSSISGNKDLYVSSIIHKTYVDINEEGTEAAAVTGAVIMKRSIEFPFEFKADHPFLFLITDLKTNSLLFVGSLKKPDTVDADDIHNEL